MKDGLTLGSIHFWAVEDSTPLENPLERGLV